MILALRHCPAHFAFVASLVCWTPLPLHTCEMPLSGVLGWYSKKRTKLAQIDFLQSIIVILAIIHSVYFFQIVLACYNFNQFGCHTIYNFMLNKYENEIFVL